MGIGSDQVFSEIKGNRNIHVKKDDFKSQNECLWTIQQLLNDLPQFSVVCNCPIIEYKCYNNSEEDRIIAQSCSTIHTGWIEKVMNGNCDPIGISVVVFKSIKMNILCNEKDMLIQLARILDAKDITELYSGCYQIVASLGPSSLCIPIMRNQQCICTKEYITHIETLIQDAMEASQILLQKLLPQISSFVKLQPFTQSFHSDWQIITETEPYANVLLRCQHSSCNLPNTDTIAVFGGYGYSANASSPSRLNDFVLLNTQTNQISFYLHSKTSSPPPRVCHAMCAIDGGVIVFGGRKSPSCPLNDCWFMDLQTNTWTEIPLPSTCPSPRWNCGITAINNHVAVLYGGRNDQTVFGDCWSVFIKRNNNSQIECKWFLLYDTDNSIYNNNPSPGYCFSPIVLPVYRNDSCDEVMIWSGMKTLLGEYADPSRVFLFKISKRQWFTMTINDPSGLFTQLIHCRCTLLNSNTYLLFGLHSTNLKPLCLCLSLKDTIMYVENWTSRFSPLQPSFQPLQSDSDPGEKWTENVDTIFSGYSVHVSSGKVFVLGGGGVFYWMPHFNQPIYCSLFDQSSQRITKKKRSKGIEENVGIHKVQKLQNEGNRGNLVLQVNDKKLLKPVKVFLEQQGYYDKSRKISSINGSSFGIPILKDDMDTLEGIASEPIKSIFHKENVVSTHLESSFSIKENVSHSLCVWCEEHGLKNGSVGLRHVEVIGNILVFDKNSFNGESSDVLWKLIVTLPSVVNSEMNSDNTNTLTPLFKEFLSSYNCQRIAIHEEIDCGPKRQSHSRIIYSLLDQEDGWVTLRQNGVLYSWPFERVMFASGNNTERKRMGDIKAKDEFVCDLYAGIGYFTIPIAVKTGVSHMICFEINEDSVNALKRNIDQNGVHEKCEVILGDNRVTTKPYHDIADRVLLGLLPSSREGWPLAIQLLKPTGGVLHLHENVHEAEFERFSTDLPKELALLAELQNKPLQFSIVHIEKVKSYAPKVHHYVFDIVCKANNSI